MLAATVRVTRDLDLAEECVQEAYVAALGAWERGGIPARPGAWLTTAARRSALNALQRRRTLAAKLPLLVDPIPAAVTTFPDDRLRLVFMCCHPALATEAQVALTLRLVCGVETAAVAQAFLVAEATMAARLTRAKKKIAAAGIPWAEPPPEELPARLDAVLTVVHLLATTGHTAPAGEVLERVDLAARALDLARMLRLLLPREPEVAGLLALLLVHHARRGTRADADGRLVRLADQDRSGWDREELAEAHALVVEALRAPGRFGLQAAIASVHAHAPTAQDTDWAEILALYDALLRAWPSPVVALNRAVAVAMVEGAEAALAEVEALERDGRLTGYRYLPATKADLLRRLDRHAEATEQYRAALELSANAAERAFLRERLDAGLR